MYFDCHTVEPTVILSSCDLSSAGRQQYLRLRLCLSTCVACPRIMDVIGRQLNNVTTIFYSIWCTVQFRICGTSQKLPLSISPGCEIQEFHFT